MPNGQFGTRLQGGKDSASERYIFTQLNKQKSFLYLLNLNLKIKKKTTTKASIPTIGKRKIGKQKV